MTRPPATRASRRRRSHPQVTPPPRRRKRRCSSRSHGSPSCTHAHTNRRHGSRVPQCEAEVSVASHERPPGQRARSAPKRQRHRQSSFLVDGSSSARLRIVRPLREVLASAPENARPWRSPSAAQTEHRCGPGRRRRVRKVRSVEPARGRQLRALRQRFVAQFGPQVGRLCRSRPADPRPEPPARVPAGR